MAIGYLLCLGGLLLVGPSPLLAPAFASASTVASLGSWLPYTSAALIAFGVGIGVVNAAPLAVLGCMEQGLERTEISVRHADAQSHHPSSHTDGARAWHAPRHASAIVSPPP